VDVNVRWQDEDGKRIEEILAPHMRISHLVLNTDLDGTTCLQFIDPYVDTTSTGFRSRSLSKSSNLSRTKSGTLTLEIIYCVLLSWQKRAGMKCIPI
jgi:hypothetical protein